MLYDYKYIIQIVEKYKFKIKEKRKIYQNLECNRLKYKQWLSLWVKSW